MTYGAAIGILRSHFTVIRWLVAALGRKTRISYTGIVVTSQLEYTADELLADGDIGEPLVIGGTEVQAFHTFTWAEELLADPNLVAGDGAAATLVSYIRADENPHVEYLKTALAEMCDITWVGATGVTYDGRDMIGPLWAHGLDRSLGSARADSRRSILGEIEHWCRARPNGADLLAEFHFLTSPGRETARA